MINQETLKTNLTVPNFKVILESTSDLIWAFSKELQLLYCNDSFKRNFQLFTGEKINEGEYLSEFSSLSRFSEFSDKWQEWFDRGFSGEIFKDNINYKLAGKTLYFTLNFYPVKQNNEITYLQITAREETIKHLYEEYIKAEKDKLEFERNNSEAITSTFDVKQERDEALQLLIENVERLQIVLEGSNDGFWDWDIVKDDIFRSKNYYTILGYQYGHIKNDLASWEKNVHPEDLDRVLEELHAHLEGKKEYFYSEYRIKTKNDEWKWILDKGKVAIRDENGNPLRIAGTISDITERKNAERVLRESEERFTNLADNLPVMIWLTDKNIQPTYVNTKGKEFAGEINENAKIIDFVHPDDAEYLKFSLISCLKNKERVMDEIRLKNKDGEYKWILANIVPRILENGELIGIIGTGIDITERKITETQLLESETQFNEITSVIGEGIFLIDKNWKVEFVNPEFKKLLGYDLIDLENLNFHQIVHKECESSECPLNKVFQNGETIRISKDYFFTNFGYAVPVSYVASPIKRNGEIVGCVTAFHDISERLEAEEEMKRYVEELQFNKLLMEENAQELALLNQKLSESEDRLKELNLSKDKFFSIISHDLRSPFTSITGFAEVLAEDVEELTKEDIKEFALNISKAAKNIQNLLENLLQWSRIQTGRIEFNPISLNISELANEIIGLYQVNATRKRINLINNLTENYTISADKFMIETVFRNLVSNSLKFTKQNGEISISAEEIENDFLQISISDNGVGMKEETLNKLFKIDQHITTVGTDKEKGTGLGLILCKEFVEKHGGKIWAESKLGEGSQFKFTLKITK